MEAAGQRASRWRRVALEHAATRSEFEAARVEVEAMAAREQGLKERVEQLRAEAGRQRAESEQRLATLASELAEEHRGAQLIAERLARYLSEFPAAREMLRWPPGGERAAG
jgi:chromosome segregation ATPase